MGQEIALSVVDPYEDWRMSPDVRALDLITEMKIEDLAGLMVHGTLPAAAVNDLGRGNDTISAAFAPSWPISM